MNEETQFYCWRKWKCCGTEGNFQQANSVECCQFLQNKQVRFLRYPPNEAEKGVSPHDAQFHLDLQSVRTSFPSTESTPSCSHLLGHYPHIQTGVTTCHLQVQYLLTQTQKSTTLTKVLKSGLMWLIKSIKTVGVVDDDDDDSGKLYWGGRERQCWECGNNQA